MAKTKILVVDDEEDVAKALEIRLKANGYDVVPAHDSIQAIMMADQERPDLIIVDIKIRGEDGYRFTERLKQADATRPIPVIFLTGVPGGEGRAYKAGACSYLMKPYDPKELLETIHDALQKKKEPRRDRESRRPSGSPSQGPPLRQLISHHHPTSKFRPSSPLPDFCREQNFTVY